MGNEEADFFGTKREESYLFHDIAEFSLHDFWISVEYDC